MRLIDELGVDPAHVHVIPHGAFTLLPARAGQRPPPEPGGRSFSASG